MFCFLVVVFFFGGGRGVFIIVMDTLFNIFQIFHENCFWFWFIFQ